MSAAGTALAAAVQAMLAADPAVGGRLNGVFEGAAAANATVPFAEIGEVLGADWSTKDRRGRELRLAITVRDAGDRGARAAAIADAAEARIAALPRLVENWQVASCALLRSRVAADGPGRWRATIEFRVRVLEA